MESDLFELVLNDLANDDLTEDLIAKPTPNIVKTEDLIAKSTPNTMKVVREYYQLRVLPNLSDQQADRIGELLELTKTDQILNVWITEVDHAVGHERNLLDQACRSSYKDQQALLREYLGLVDLCNNNASDSSIDKPTIIC